MIKHIPGLIVLILLITSCTHTEQETISTNQPDSTFIKSLKEKQVGKGALYISIPPGYSLASSEGPDFFVYYLTPPDTARKVEFSSGFYFGNFPSEFAPENDSCKVEHIPGRLMNDSTNWTVYHCSGGYSIQTILKNKNADAMDQQIHAFGRGASDVEVKEIMEMFSTLRIK